MFAQGTIIIDRSTSEIYSVLTDLKFHISIWEIFIIRDPDSIAPDSTEVDATCKVGRTLQPCTISLHFTRPGSGLVTRVQTPSGEIAGEWRLIEDGTRTKIELNIEGQGGGLAASINIRQLAPRILLRLKQNFDRA